MFELTGSDKCCDRKCKISRCWTFEDVVERKAVKENEKEGRR